MFSEKLHLSQHHAAFVGICGVKKHIVILMDNHSHQDYC